MNASLVMRDRETDSWWSIITGDAIGGVLQGTQLVEVPVAEKLTWGEWKKRHPDTLVLSVDGKEHDESNPYASYFTSSRTFRNLSTSDTRMYDKASIYAFQLNGIPYAVAHSKFEGGRSFKLSKTREVFLFRKKSSSIFESTYAYIADVDHEGDRFVKKDGKWSYAVTGDEFTSGGGFAVEPEAKAEKAAAPTLVKLNGFDTFWYIWATTHENVKVLE